MFIIPNNPGFVPRGPDPRDIPYRAANNLGAITIDWNRRTNSRLRYKALQKQEDQGGSSSCVGQGWAKDQEMNDEKQTGQFADLSAEDVYAWIYMPPDGGAWGYKGGTSIRDRGVSLEHLAPSYNKGLPPDENFMRVRHEEPFTRQAAMSHRIKGYTVVEGLDEMAHAILTNDKVIFGVIGSNQGWQSGDVRPPLPGEKVWGHFILGIDIGVKNGKRGLEFANWWSGQWGHNGFGFINEDYFANGYVYSGYVSQDISDDWLEQINMKRVIRLDGSSDQYIVEGGRKILIPDLDTRSYYRDILKIIPDSEPEVVSKAVFDSLMESEALSIGVMRAAKNAYPVFRDAFESNLGQTDER